MSNHPLETRTNKSSNFVLQVAASAIVIVLFFSIYQSVAYKGVTFNVLNISIMVGIWLLILFVAIRSRKSIEIYNDHILIKSRNGEEKNLATSNLYLNIVKHPAQSLKATRTLQLRTIGSHKKVFSIEPYDRKDDKYLEDLLRNTCKIKVDNWVE